jgi:alanyl-tRNA synthetase
VPIDEARAQGVVALFGEKYGDTVRTVRAGDDSFELCGGNHVDRTGDIGHVRITVETGVAAGVRRLEAVVGHAADALVDAQRALLRTAAAVLKTEPQRLPQRAEQLLAELREQKRALEKARRTGGAVDPDTLIAGAFEIHGVPVIAAEIPTDDRAALAALADRIRDKRPDAVVVLCAAIGDQAAVIAAIGPRLKGDKRFHAGRIVAEVSAALDGRGGGRPDFAQGGGLAARIADAVAAIPSIVARLAD